jgi:16S rRNA (cytidine1402-2'-O)-methyltransferase
MPAAPSPKPPLQPGTLYLVATPIGNLEDITLRALRTLEGCDLVAAEDTRHTGRLLQHFGIHRPLISYHQFNEAQRTGGLLERLRQGQKIALVSDAGSPGISDPGQRVVQAAWAEGIRVEAVPGPCALIAALTSSGLPTEEFHFIGYLPHKPGARRRRLDGLKTVPGTLVFYESPFRVARFLAELEETWPQRRIVLARELTKKFEELWGGTPGDLLRQLGERPQRGEYVVLVGPEPEAASANRRLVPDRPGIADSGGVPNDASPH